MGNTGLCVAQLLGGLGETATSNGGDEGFIARNVHATSMHFYCSCFTCLGCVFITFQMRLD